MGSWGRGMKIIIVEKKVAKKSIEYEGMYQLDRTY